MKLQWIIGTQTNVQSNFVEVRERIPFVSKEQRIVAQRTHGDTDLRQIEQVLQCRHLAKQNAM
jgi:hypothetical protein